MLKETIIGQQSVLGLNVVVINEPVIGIKRAIEDEPIYISMIDDPALPILKAVSFETQNTNTLFFDYYPSLIDKKVNHKEIISFPMDNIDFNQLERISKYIKSINPEVKVPTYFGENKLKEVANSDEIIILGPEYINHRDYIRFKDDVITCFPYLEEETKINIKPDASHNLICSFDFIDSFPQSIMIRYYLDGSNSTYKKTEIAVISVDDLDMTKLKKIVNRISECNPNVDFSDNLIAYK